MCWDDDNRDYADLHNPDLAVYNFRGYTVLKYNKKTKTFDIGDDANMCMFCTDDLLALSDFLLECHKFATGQPNELQNVEVN